MINMFTVALLIAPFSFPSLSVKMPDVRVEIDDDDDEIIDVVVDDIFDVVVDGIFDGVIDLVDDIFDVVDGVETLMTCNKTGNRLGSSWMRISVGIYLRRFEIAIRYTVSPAPLLCLNEVSKEGRCIVKYFCLYKLLTLLMTRTS